MEDKPRGSTWKLHDYGALCPFYQPAKEIMHMEVTVIPKIIVLNLIHIKILLNSIIKRYAVTVL